VRKKPHHAAAAQDEEGDPRRRPKHHVVDDVRAIAVVCEPAPKSSRAPPHAHHLLAPQEIR
jgi:hypothetical protein